MHSQAVRLDHVAGCASYPSHPQLPTVTIQNRRQLPSLVYIDVFSECVLCTCGVAARCPLGRRWGGQTQEPVEEAGRAPLTTRATDPRTGGGGRCGPPTTRATDPRTGGRRKRATHHKGDRPKNRRRRRARAQLPQLPPVTHSYHSESTHVTFADLRAEVCLIHRFGGCSARGVGWVLCTRREVCLIHRFGGFEVLGVGFASDLAFEGPSPPLEAAGGHGRSEPSGPVRCPGRVGTRTGVAAPGARCTSSSTRWG